MLSKDSFWCIGIDLQKRIFWHHQSYVGSSDMELDAFFQGICMKLALSILQLVGVLRRWAEGTMSTVNFNMLRSLPAQDLLRHPAM